LNDPAISYRSIGNGGKLPSGHYSLISVSAPNVVVETIKRAEDGNGIIVRLYESQRKRGSVSLRLAFPVERAWSANLLEENESALEVQDETVSFNIRPYQIMTIRIEGR